VAAGPCCGARTMAPVPSEPHSTSVPTATTTARGGGGRPRPPTRWAMPSRRNHVLGVGHASLSLIRAAGPVRPVGSLLDLGTGNGRPGTARDPARTAGHRDGRFDAGARTRRRDVPAQRTRRRAGPRRMVRAGRATAVSTRSCAIRPFVVGPPAGRLHLPRLRPGRRRASALVVRQLPGFLNDGGVGQLLASWLHVEGEDWGRPGRRAGCPRRPTRGSSQRDVGRSRPLCRLPGCVTPEIDPRSPEGRAKSAAWLDWFAANDVGGIGFGFVTLRRCERGSLRPWCARTCGRAYDDPLGAEAGRWLDRVDWLRHNGDSLLDVRFRVTADGVAGIGRRTRRRGLDDDDPAGCTARTVPAGQHEVDELATRLLAGCQGALPLDGPDRAPVRRAGPRIGRVGRRGASRRPGARAPRNARSGGA